MTREKGNNHKMLCWRQTPQQELRFAAAFVILILFLVTPLSAGEPRIVHELAHIGDGSGVRTAFLVSNDNDEEVGILIELFAENGEPLSLRIGEETASSFSFLVPAKGTIQVVTAGDSDPIQSGWARLGATAPVAAQVLFEIRVGNELVTLAAVESPGGLLGATVFVDQRVDSNTGLAVANLSESGPIRVILTLRDEDGETVAVQELTLGPLAKTARFVLQFFEGVGDVQGTIWIQASGRFTAVALQQTGLILGSLPPIT